MQGAAKASSNATPIQFNANDWPRLSQPLSTTTWPRQAGAAVNALVMLAAACLCTLACGPRSAQEPSWLIAMMRLSTRSRDSQHRATQRRADRRSNAQQRVHHRRLSKSQPPTDIRPGGPRPRKATGASLDRKR